jgi:acetyltransferase
MSLRGFRLVRQGLAVARGSGMSIRNLENALHPRSVAVFGGSERAGSVGAVVMRNLVEGGFDGPIWAVNPKYSQVMGRPCFAKAADLPEAPDIALVLTPPDCVPEVIADLGRRGGRLAVVVTAGLSGGNGLRQAMLDAARPNLLRIVGPNTLGLMIPPLGLNAGFAHMAAQRGRLALLSQSGAIATALIDWAAERGIGFSQIVSLGDMADVDVGDYLDLLAGDGRTAAILMYLESIPSPRKFLSAARAAARLKPVIAIKAGRHAAAAKAAATHTGALAGVDAVVDAALRRAGILRVRGLAELFDAAETLARFRPLAEGRVGIVTNGGGAGVLAVDRLMDEGGALAELSSATIAALDPVLPPNWSRGNPVDIIGDASPERYVAALERVAEDDAVDVVLVMNCPTALARPEDAAQAVAAKATRGTIDGKPVLSCWLGGATARPARAVLRGAGVASFDTPATAAAAVAHLTDWGKAQAALLRVPDRSAEEALQRTPKDSRKAAGAVMASVAAEGRAILTEPEAKAVLTAYGIPVSETRTAASPAEVGRIAAEMLEAAETRLVVKLVSREITHKSDVGGVVLDVENGAAAEAAAEAIGRRVRARFGAQALDGFSVQPMIRRRGAYELIAGIGRDPVFGPTILFGAGGVGVETIRDTAVALPPLDAGLCTDLIRRTRIGALLAGFRDQPPVNAAALQGALIALSHLIEDFPCVRGVDVNPLLADAEGVIALDARIEIDPADMDRKGPNPDLAIRPYPSDWRRVVTLKGVDYVLRAIRPTDVVHYPDFIAHLTPDDIRMRFLAPRKHFPDEMGLRLTQLDYDRDMAFIALDPSGVMAGVARMYCDPDRRRAEYALIVRSDIHGRGIGTALLGHLIDYARTEGLEGLEGLILAENTAMQGLVKRFGFEISPDPDDRSIVQSRLVL